MEQPPGFVDSNFLDHVCHLYKFLYGLKQAPHAWFHRLSEFLLQLGFHYSKVDTSLFIWCNGTSKLFVLIYVDDILVTGASSALINWFMTQIQSTFPIRDLGTLNYFLGMEAIHLPNGLILSQAKYIFDLLQKF